MSEAIKVSRIRTDGGTQPRVEIDEAYVVELFRDIEDGAELPPLTVFYDGTDYWLADGFHRLAAYCRHAAKTVPCDVKQGTQADAQWWSYGANKGQDTNGLRRKNEDKRRAVLAALEHPKAAGKSNELIAEHVGVSAQTIKRYRPASTKLEVTPRLGRDGKTYNVTNIGKSPRVLASEIGEDEPAKKTTVEVVDTDTGEVIQNAEIIRTSAVTVSAADQGQRAMAYGACEGAVNALALIPQDNPYRADVLDRVAAWIEHNR